eukprot:CAMPEP_0172858748 /NCGR_PEP_ID=MMETSP1075-20121228/67805_1 /TAXON_ID=2916 /ORGANISM="Ceratium fusus, Strain PA161109" /LENGTH=82 /DNA_ID=CAMNT_0013706367 /DNA_START=82 /DNA_END=327 /DNA_ORIENTATION=+
MSAQPAHLLPTVLALVAVVLVGRWAATTFVPSVADQSGVANNEVVLRGSVAASAAAVAAAAGPLAASAEDPVFDYNMRGEIT